MPAGAVRQVRYRRWPPRTGLPPYAGARLLPSGSGHCWRYRQTGLFFSYEFPYIRVAIYLTFAIIARNCDRVKTATPGQTTQARSTLASQRTPERAMTQRLLDIYRSNQREGNLLFFMILAFLAIFFMPAGTERFDNAVLEAFRLTNWYAREHVILCLLPAFLIAGAMAVYISQGSVMR